MKMKVHAYEHDQPININAEVLLLKKNKKIVFFDK